jgi:hypothetical protein
MQARCLSVYSGSLEQEATASAAAIITPQVRRVALWLIGWPQASRVQRA